MMQQPASVKSLTKLVSSWVGLTKLRVGFNPEPHGLRPCSAGYCIECSHSIRWRGCR